MNLITRTYRLGGDEEGSGGTTGTGSTGGETGTGTTGTESGSTGTSGGGQNPPPRP